MKAFEAFARLGPTALVAALEALAFLLAVAFAWRRRDVRPVAVVIGAVLAADIATFALWSVLEPPRLGDPPLAGWMRLAAHVEHAAFVLPRAALAAAAWHACLGRSGRHVWIVGGVALAILVASYPAIRGASLARFYLATEVLLLVLAYRAVLSWMGRQFRTGEPAKLPPVLLATLLAAESTAVLVGPYRQGFWGAWALAQLAYAIAFGGVAIVLAAALAKGGEPWRGSDGQP